MPATALKQNDAASDAGFALGLEAELIERAKALRPLLTRNARLAEAQGYMTDEVIQALDDAQLWAMITPKRWGGLGLPSAAMHRINREISKGDTAAAWVMQIINGCTWIATTTSDRLQEEIFSGGKPPRICSSFAVSVPAKAVEGGYIVNGAWPYNSGWRQSVWGQYLVTIEEADGTTKFGNFAYIPVADLKLGAPWDCAGLQGTSSDSVVAENVFVPEHRMVRAEATFGHREPGKRHVGAASDNWPLIPTIRASGTGLLIGAAEAAYELALDTAQKRGVAATTYSKQMNSPVVQRNLGEAGAKIRGAKLLGEEVCEILDAAALAGETLPQLERAELKAQGALIVELCTSAMDKIMSAAGSSAYSRSNDLQRFWRDFSVAAHHAINAPDVGYEIFGREVLGVTPNIVPLMGF
jgi:alkylation response protein AidB-like acyl-CoA dehydrogenase